MNGKTAKIFGRLIALSVGVLMGGGVAARAQGPSPNVHHFAGRLNNPRGLRFGWHHSHDSRPMRASSFACRSVHRCFDGADIKDRREWRSDDGG